MKIKLFVKNVLLLIMFVGIQSCSKNVETPVITSNQNVNKEAELATDPAFVGLNDALIHFDPHYLQMVYGDQRTTSEINEASKILFTKLQADPENTDLQKQIASFYKLNSVEELKYYSDQILLHISTIKNKYYGNKNNFSKAEIKNYFKSRALYARNKMDSIRSNSNKIKISSMYDDYILNPEPPAFHFFAALDLEDLNLDAECTDACCLEYKSCNDKAEKTFFTNAFNFSFTAGTSLGIAGSSMGSTIPLVGTVIGARFGATLGIYLGAYFAQRIYFADLNICVIDYKACVARKNGH